MAKEKDREESLPSMKKDILADIREKLTSSGTGFKLRVMKKIEGGGFSFRGAIDGTCEDIEGELLKKYGDGEFKVIAVYHDNKRIDGIPQMAYIVGDAGAAAGKPGAVPISSNLAGIKERIEEARLNRELKRAEKELRKVDDEDEGGEDVGTTKEIAQYVATLEAKIEKMEKSQEDNKLIAAIEALGRKMDGPSQKSSEVEDLRRQIAALGEQKKADAFQKSIDALTEKIEKIGSAKPVAAGAAQVVTALSPFVPALVAWISKSGSSGNMIDAVEKITKAMKSDFSMKDLIQLATPLLPTLMSAFKQPDPTAMFKLIGDMVSPMIEAAASAAANPPAPEDMGAAIKNVLGMVSKGLSDAAQLSGKNLETEQVRASAAVRIKQIEARQGGGRERPRVVRDNREQPQQPQQRPQQAPPQNGNGQQQGQPQQQRQAPAQQQRPAQAQATQRPAPQSQQPAQPRRVEAIPAVAFANKLARAIGEQDTEYRFYANLAEQDLPADHVAHLKSFKTAEAMASYFGGLPGVDSAVLASPYALKWFTGFVKAYQGESAPLGPTVAPPTAAAMSRPAIDIPTPTLNIASVTIKKEPQPITPEATVTPAVMVHAEPAPAESRRVDRNAFKYPETSKVEMVEYDDMTMPLEFPSAETVAKREQERVAAVEKARALKEKQMAELPAIVAGA